MPATATIKGNVIRIVVARTSISFNLRVRVTTIQGTEFTFGTEISCFATLEDLGKDNFTNVTESITVGDDVTVNVIKIDGAWRITGIDSQPQTHQSLGDFLCGLEKASE